MEIELKAIIKFVEDNLFNGVTIKVVAHKFAYSQSYLSVLFKSSFNITLNDYIKKRRLSKIAFMLKLKQISIKQCVELLNYKNTERFYRAFKQFHNATPGQVQNGEKFNCYNKIELIILKQGGDMFKYNTIKVSTVVLTGFKTKIFSSLNGRFDLQHDFYESTREKQEELKLLSSKEIVYGYIDNYHNNSFDYYIAYDCGGVCPNGYELITIPEGKYHVFETQRERKPIGQLSSLWLAIETELDKINMPIIEKIYWFNPQSQNRDNRYIELLVKKI